MVAPETGDDLSASRSTSWRVASPPHQIKSWIPSTTACGASRGRKCPASGISRRSKRFVKWLADSNTIVGTVIGGYVARRCSISSNAGAPGALSYRWRYEWIVTSTKSGLSKLTAVAARSHTGPRTKRSLISYTWQRRGFWDKASIWRESVGIEPTSPLAKASTVLKTVRTTRSVLSHMGREAFPISRSLPR
jgi:hypothetical protein